MPVTSPLVGPPASGATGGCVISLPERLGGSCTTVQRDRSDIIVSHSRIRENAAQTENSANQGPPFFITFMQKRSAH